MYILGTVTLILFDNDQTTLPVEHRILYREREREGVVRKVFSLTINTAVS